LGIKIVKREKEDMFNKNYSLKEEAGLLKGKHL
jgi:hypothetical protein